MRYLGDNLEVYIYYHERDWEYRAEAVLGNTFALGMLVGYSERSPQAALNNLLLLLQELGFTYDSMDIVSDGGHVKEQ